MKSESRIQQEIVMWYRNNYCLKHHKPQHVIFSVPNETNSKRETLQKKAIGLMSGVSDLIVLKPNETVFVEVKNAKGVQSQSQKVFQKIVEALGFKYILIRSLDEFKKMI